MHKSIECLLILRVFQHSVISIPIPHSKYLKSLELGWVSVSPSEIVFNIIV